MNSPPQFGQTPFSRSFTQVSQNVHSNEQISASVEVGARSRSQHSQFGRMSSIDASRGSGASPRSVVAASTISARAAGPPTAPTSEK
nr:hypothetical protein [Solihabitans fulvus]